MLPEWNLERSGCNNAKSRLRVEETKSTNSFTAVLIPINVCDVDNLRIASAQTISTKHRSTAKMFPTMLQLSIWMLFLTSCSAGTRSVILPWLQLFFFCLLWIFNEHHITCGEPVYPLGNAASLLVIDESDQFQTCFCISVWDKSISPPLEECGLRSRSKSLFSEGDHLTLLDRCKYTTTQHWRELRLKQKILGVIFKVLRYPAR